MKKQNSEIKLLPNFFPAQNLGISLFTNQKQLIKKLSIAIEDFPFSHVDLVKNFLGETSPL